MHLKMHSAGSHAPRGGMIVSSLICSESPIQAGSRLQRSSFRIALFHHAMMDGAPSTD